MPLQSPFLNHFKRLARAYVPLPLRRPVAAGLAAMQRHFGSDQFRLAQLERLHHALNRGLAPDQIAIRDHITLNIDPASRDPFEHFCFRSLEMKKEMDFFISIMSDKQCLLDIGSLHGIFSLVFCHKRPVKAIAIEPSPIAFPALMHNIKSNAAPIDAFKLAASDRSGLIAMKLDWQHLIVVKSNQDHADPALQQVPASTMDDLIEENNYEVDLIKIDVEGHEGSVLRGLRKTIGEKGPDILIEIHPPMIEQGGESVADVVGALTSHGYGLTDLDGRAVPPEHLYRQADVFRIFATRPRAGG